MLWCGDFGMSWDGVMVKILRAMKEVGVKSDWTGVSECSARNMDSYLTGKV